MGRKTYSFEGICIQTGKPDTVFYTSKNDKHMTAIATYYGRKINTERLIVISGSREDPKAGTITKVTIVS